LRGRKTVRADRRLRTDEKHIRAQSAILDKSNSKSLLFLLITVFLVRITSIIARSAQVCWSNAT